MLYHLTELKYPEVEKLCKKGAIAVLPVAAHEQHGAHLPIGTDSIILEGVMAAFADEMRKGPDVVVLPPVLVGKSNEHMSFSGTMSLSFETLAALVRDMARSASLRFSTLMGEIPTFSTPSPATSATISALSRSLSTGGSPTFGQSCSKTFKRVRGTAFSTRASSRQALF